VNSFVSFLDKVACKGGGDACEDVIGGLEQAAKLNWSAKIRCLFLVTHSPPHGRRFYEPSRLTGSGWDELPDTPNQFDKADDSLRALVAADIQLVCCVVEECTERAYSVFEQVYNRNARSMNMMRVNLDGNAQQFCKAVVSSTTSSIATSVVRWHKEKLAQEHANRPLHAIVEEEEGQSSEMSSNEDEDVALGRCLEPIDWAAASGWKEHRVCAFSYSLPHLPDLTDRIDCALEVVTSQKTVRISPSPFGKGRMRLAFAMVVLLPDGRTRQFVAKQHIKRRDRDQERQLHYSDIVTQEVARSFAAAFTAESKKKLQFLKVGLMQLEDGDGEWYYVEPYMSGDYTKYTNNTSYASQDSELAQAFSHFTWHKSGGRLMVTDIQGVSAALTDPQIHSENKSFGRGNLGTFGIDSFFMMHQCNHICHRLGLQKSKIQMSSFCRSGSVTSWYGSDDIGDANASVVDPQVSFTEHNNVVVRWRSVTDFKEFQVVVCTFTDEVFATVTSKHEALIPRLAPSTLHTVYIRGVSEGSQNKPGKVAFKTPQQDEDSEEDRVQCSGCHCSVLASSTVGGTFSTGVFFCPVCTPKLRTSIQKASCAFCAQQFEYSAWEEAVLEVNRPLFCSACFQRLFSFFQ